jgi:hypothetical protein
MALEHSEFSRVLLEQVAEVEEHLVAERGTKAVYEVIDIIGVALNWLRRMGLGPVDVAAAARLRAEERYVGQTEAILSKYHGG